MANIKILPVELQKVAERELGEVPARIASDLETLKTLIKQEPHLNARLDDQFLIQFLRGCKYNLEKTKTKIDLFFTLKSKYPNLFNVTDVNEPNFKEMYSHGFAMPLPQPLNDQGARLYFLKCDGDVAKGLIDLEDIFRVSSVLHEIMMVDDPYACINGIIYIIDLQHITINFLSRLTPSLIANVILFYEKCLPLRIKAIEVINMPRFFQSVMNMVLGLLSHKLRKRVSIYGRNYDSIYTKIPLKYFPAHAGGENSSFDQLLMDFENKLLEYENYFNENATYGTNELLRFGKPTDSESKYGVDGSFRKLNVD